MQKDIKDFIGHNSHNQPTHKPVETSNLTHSETTPIYNEKLLFNKEETKGDASSSMSWERDITLQSFKKIHISLTTI
jgi:hypothetical protein